MCINHLNGIKNDNRLCNLEVVTWSENKKHAANVLGCSVGERNGMNKLKQEEVLDIYRRAVSGNNHREIAKEYNISRVTVSDILCKKTWKHLHYRKEVMPLCQSK